MNDQEKLDDYLAGLEHPLKDEINAVRKIIANANSKLKERIKWNAPSFYYKKDMLAFHIREQKRVHLVFVFYTDDMIESDLLEGNYKDRRMAYFYNSDDITAKKEELERVVNEWVNLIETNL